MGIVCMNQSNKIYPTVILFIIFFVCVCISLSLKTSCAYSQMSLVFLPPFFFLTIEKPRVFMGENEKYGMDSKFFKKFDPFQIN